MSGQGTLRNLAGALALDWPRYQWAFHSKGAGWVRLCNRHERLEHRTDERGVRCVWPWTSTLYAPRVLPSLGLGLLRRAEREHPFHFAREPKALGAPPQLTFIIGHRGRTRLPHLLVTLGSIAAQQGAHCETIVVEQSVAPEIREDLPPWVRYVHTPLPHPAMPYCRAWAFNVGARLARGSVLCLHDNDLPAPADYALEHLGYLARGYQVVNLKRFIFYLDPNATDALFGQWVSGASASGGLWGEGGKPMTPPEKILQNALGGGSLVIDRAAYFAIGGFDEAFVGWGGEDNELWELVQTLRLYPYGYLPMLHLWHPAQPDKGHDRGRGGLTASLFDARMALPVAQRIEELCARSMGDPRSPNPPWSPPAP